MLNTIMLVKLIFCLFVQPFLSLGQQLSFDRSQISYEWNIGNNADDTIVLSLTNRGIITEVIQVSCEIQKTYVDSSVFTYSDGSSSTTLNFSPNDDSQNLLGLSWGQTGSTTPGGFSTIQCSSTNNDQVADASLEVQILFPPKLSIYPELLYLPHNSIQNETYNMKVGLSALAKVDIRIRCLSVSNSLAANFLNIEFTDVLIIQSSTDYFVNVELKINSPDPQNREVSVSCNALSLSGVQYIEATSTSNEASIKVQTLEGANLIPNVQTIRDRSFEVYLELSERHNVELEYKCYIFSNLEATTTDSSNNTITWLELFNSETCATFSDLSRDANGWFIESETVLAKSSRHELKISKSGFSSEREDLSVVCCDPNDVKTNTANVYVRYSLIQIGQSSNSASSKTEILNPKWVNPAKCQCDLTANKCDINCCCDTTDCSDATIALFDCIPGIAGGFDEDLTDQKCKFSEDENPFFCVETKSPNWIGYYFPDKQDFELIGSPDTGYNGITFNEPKFVVDNRVFYTRGNPLQGKIGDNTEFLLFPGGLLSGLCARKNYIQFLVDSSARCAAEATQSTCQDLSSPLNARNYLLSTGRTFPRPLENYFILVGENVDVQGTETYYCARDQAQLDDYLADRTVLPPKCWFNDQNILPPEPAFDSSDSSCSNVLLEAQYKFNWLGEHIVSYEATYVMGTITVTQEPNYQVPLTYDFLEVPGTSTGPITFTSNSSSSVSIEANYDTFVTTTTVKTTYTPSTLPQKFLVNFVYQTTEQIEELSGNPGYLYRYPLRQALGSFDAESQLESLELTPDGIKFPLPNSNGLCNQDKKTPILFNVNFTSSCFVELTFDDFQNCSEVSEKIRDLLPDLDSNVYIARKGNSDVTNLEDWVNFLVNESTSGDWGQFAENVQDVFDTEIVEVVNEDGETINDLYASRTGVCPKMPSGYSFEFLVTDSGIQDGIVQFEIVASRVRENYSDIELNCFQIDQREKLCNQGSTVTQSFPFSLDVKFFTFPNPATQPKKSLSEILRDKREDCTTNENCWGNMFYPLNKPSSENREKYLIFQENTIYTITLALTSVFVWKFTSPWTGQR